MALSMAGHADLAALTLFGLRDPLTPTQKPLKVGSCQPPVSKAAVGYHTVGYHRFSLLGLSHWRERLRVPHRQEKKLSRFVSRSVATANHSIADSYSSQKKILQQHERSRAVLKRNRGSHSQKRVGPSHSKRSPQRRPPSTSVALILSSRLSRKSV